MAKSGIFAAATVEANNHAIDAIILRKSLIQWGQRNFRPFSWRITEDPYQVLLSEVMLHRTQARQVAPVYEHFVQTYPDASSLARATREELHDSLYSLGLRWRVDLIYEMSRELRDRFDGQVPIEKADLLSLPGVSAYIAGAVRCFSWNLPEPLADTNTVRVIGRLFGLTIKDSSRRNRQFRDLLTALLDMENPRAYNYALLDLADKVCVKKQAPLCEQCPIIQWCLYARQNGRYLA